LSPRPPPTGVFDSRHTESRTAQRLMSVNLAFS
jgi:hypothetical protein